MAEAIPFVTAGIGFLIGGPAGAQVGWMIGSALYSATTDPTVSVGNPSQQPSAGSNIRGATLPVIFGTVRCPGYIVWQNDFRATKRTRKVGSGKQKTKQEYYAYSWDFVFHLGMSTRPMRIVGIWEGSERVQDESLYQITFANGESYFPSSKIEKNQSLLKTLGGSLWSGILGSALNRVLESQQAGKSLTFTEAYWYGAHGTTDPETGWAYFQSAEDAPDIRWPHTMWLGFRHLDLGEQPRVPALNFEVTPDDDDANFRASYNDTVVTPEQSGGTRNYAVGITASGRHAIYDNSFNSDFFGCIVDARTGRVCDTISAAELLALFPEHAAFISASDPSTIRCVPGTSDVVVMLSGLGGGGPNANYTHWYFLRIDDETGTYSRVGFTRYQQSGLPLRNALGSTQVCLDENKSFIYCITNSLGGDTLLWKVAYPGTMGDSEAVSFLDITVTLGTDLLNAGASNADYYFPNDVFNGFIMPKGNNYRAYFYVAKARCDQNPNDNSVVALYQDTYPDGFMFYIEWTPEFFIAANATICHGDFDQNGPPFDNATINQDGTALDTDGFGYMERMMPAPSVLGKPSSDWIVVFERMLDNAANNSIGGYHTMRCFRYRVADGTFEQAGTEVVQQLEDNMLKYDTTSGNRFTLYDRMAHVLAYATLTGEVFRVGSMHDAAAGLYMDVARVAFAAIGTKDFTPPEIIRDIFIDPAIGFGRDATEVDTDSYNAAVDYCRERGILISVSYSTPQERAALFEQAMNVYGGWVAWNGYKLKFGIPHTTETPVGVIDNSCFVQEDPKRPVPVLTSKRRALQDTANKITVRFFDRSLAYRGNAITIGDEVDQDLNGVRHKIIDTNMVMAHETAYKLADRMLYGNIYARNVWDQVPVGWKAAHYEPGDLITLVDSSDGVNTSARIVRRVEKKRGVMLLTMVEELNYLGEGRVYFEPALPKSRGLAAAADIPIEFNAYELPSDFQTEGPKYYVGWTPGGPSASAGLYTSASTTEFRLYGSVLPFPDSGILVSPLPLDPSNLNGIQVKLNVRRNTTNQMSGQVWLPGELENYNEFDRAAGLSTFWAGSEMLAYEGATLVGSNIYELGTVYRGWGGTGIQAHTPGNAFWAHVPADGGGIFAVPYGADAIGSEFYYKIVPVGFDGIEVDPTSVSYKQYQILGTHFRPKGIGQGNIRVLVGSDQTVPASLATTYGPLDGSSLSYINPFFVRNVGSSDERNVMFTWPEIAEATGYGAQGYGSQLYGGFAQPANVTWRVQIVGSGGATVREVDVTTPGYPYNALLNVSDNGAWRGNVAAVITPRNAYGLSPVSTVVSLALNGA